MKSPYSGDAPVRPIFIVGSYRSGTSVLTWCLGQHSNIWAIPESYWLTRMCSDMDYFYRTGTHYKRAHLKVTGISRDFFFSYWRRALHGFVMEAQEQWLKKSLYLVRKFDDHNYFINNLVSRPDAPKTRWVDGTPENSHYITPLSSLFPEARFIHLVRDPHKVVTSLLGFSRIGGAQHTVSSAYETWHRLASDAFRAEKAYGSELIRRFRFEAIVDAPEDTLPEVLHFVGEPYETECLKPLHYPINSTREASPQEYDRDMQRVLDCRDDIADTCRNLYQELCAPVHYEADLDAQKIFTDRAADYFMRRNSLH